MQKWILFATLGLWLTGCGSKSAQQTPVTTAQGQLPGYAAASQPAQPAQPVPPAPGDNAAVQPPADPQMLIPSGTRIQVRLNQELDTRRNRAGDRFTASLVAPIEDQGRVLVPQGTVFNGHVTASRPSGRLKGRAVLGVTLDSFEMNGQRYQVETTSSGRTSKRHRKRNLVLIGGGAGTGAAIGAIAAGGTGALIGAGAGAAAGTAGAVITGKKQVALRAESLLTFRLEEGVEM